MSSPLELIRPDLRGFKAYEHAVYDPGLSRLHANEARWRHGFDTTDDGLNVYPDPQPADLLRRLAALYDIDGARLLLTRGSDDGIDVLCRAFCRAGQDRVVVCPPTFGMYAVSARIQGAEVVDVPLAESGFALDAEAVVSACPYCNDYFANTAKECDRLLQVYDVTQLLYQSLTGGQK